MSLPDSARIHSPDKGPMAISKPDIMALRTTDGWHLVIRNPLALCYMSHISGGGHPPNFAKNFVKRASARITIPLSPRDFLFPSGLGQAT